MIKFEDYLNILEILGKYWVGEVGQMKITIAKNFVPQKSKQPTLQITAGPLLAKTL